MKFFSTSFFLVRFMHVCVFVCSIRFVMCVFFLSWKEEKKTIKIYFLLRPIFAVIVEIAERIKRRKIRIIRWNLKERKKINLRTKVTVVNQRRFWKRFNLLI